jgi:hypothetical protein
MKKLVASVILRRHSSAHHRTTVAPIGDEIAGCAFVLHQPMDQLRCNGGTSTKMSPLKLALLKRPQSFERKPKKRRPVSSATGFYVERDKLKLVLV